jgi:hypothetical protein
MNTSATRFLTALGLAGILALSAATSSFAQRQCIPQYDSSGAQTEPYCD